MSQVLPLAPASAEEALKLAVAEVMASPAAALQALYDHAHDSYSQVCPARFLAHSHNPSVPDNIHRLASTVMKSTKGLL